MRILKHTLLVSILLVVSYQVQAQCCAAGNPVSSGDGIGEGGKKKLTLSLSHKYSYSDTYYEGNQLSSYSYIEDSHFNFSSLNARYGLTEKLAIYAELGYFIDKAQSFSFGDFEREAVGLGDANLGASYVLYQTKSKRFSLIPTARITLPIGQFDKTYGPVVLPIDIQPSSGSFKYNGGLTLIKRFEHSKLILSSSNFMEYSQQIDTERTRYKYGNLYNFSLMASYPVAKKLKAAVMVQSQIREKATDSKGNEVNASGGHVMFLNPQLSYAFKHDYQLTFTWEQPIYKNMNGTQLTNNYAFSLKLAKTFDFHKEDTPLALNSDSLNNYALAVRGICLMCKERIEKIAMQTKGVKSATWDLNKQILQVYFEGIVDFSQLSLALAEAGHDTDLHTASKKAYRNLHVCCKYRDE